MNARVSEKLFVVFFILCLALVGCQGETVIIEKEMDCTVEDTNGADGIYLEDPELGKMERAEYNWLKFDCPETYMDGTIYSLSDTELHDDGSYFVTGWNEMVTKEGGIWKGTCEFKLTADDNLQTCTLTGEGKYKGMKNEVSVVIEANIFKTTIRVTKVPEK